MLKDKYNVSISLTDGISSLFSSELLIHRQSSNPHTIKNELLINFALDGTQRLFTHIKHIFVRKHTY